jgi:hypothetical protein
MSVRSAVVGLVVAVWTALLAGCGIAGAAPPAGVFVEYYRGRELATPDYLVVEQNRRAVLVRGEAEWHFTLDEDTFRHLQDAMDAVEFKGFAPEYPGGGCGGGYGQWYQITHEGYTVWMMKAAVPRQLQPIVDTLNRVIDDESAGVGPGIQGGGNVLHTGTPSGG